MPPKDLRQALPLFEDFLERFTRLRVDNKRKREPQTTRDAYPRGSVFDAESTETADAIALKVHGDSSEVRMAQVFLGQSASAVEPPRKALARWVDQELRSEVGKLIVDESGTQNAAIRVGVARQYCGATDKIDNCQMGVYLAYANAAGLTDERLYLPEEEFGEDVAPTRRGRGGRPCFAVTRSWHWNSFATSDRELAMAGFDGGYRMDPEFMSGLAQLGERSLGEVPETCRGWLRRPKV